MFYALPPGHAGAVDELEQLIHKYKAGAVTAAELKAHRVPFGVYEQRTTGTFMMRVRCPGGALTPAQLTAIADTAQKYGADTLHITTRQEMQIHDMRLESIAPAMQELAAYGLSSRGGGGNTVRNIMASWDSGVSRTEVFDVLPYACALTTQFLREPDSYLLPRKYKISFSNSPADNANAAFNDIGFIASEGPGGAHGFKVYVAGGFGRNPSVGKVLHAWIPVSETYATAYAVKKIFGRYGNRRNRHAARLRFLWDSLGEKRFRELYNRERAQILDQPQPDVPVFAEINRSSPNKAEPELPRRSAFEQWRQRYTAAQKQDGFYSVIVPIRHGTVTVSAAKKIAAFLQNFGDNVLRCTMSQNFAFRNIPEQFLYQAFDCISNVTEFTEVPLVLGNSVACAGADTCRLGICRPRPALDAVCAHLRQSSIDLDRAAQIKLHLSGCSNSCGQHLIADLGFAGKAGRRGERLFAQYTVVAGSVSQPEPPSFAAPMGEIAARNLPQFVADVLSDFCADRRPTRSFKEYLDNGGDGVIRELCRRYAVPPPLDEHPEYYRDWGCSGEFSVAGRGTGECAAGLYDLIDLDLRQMQALREKIQQVAPGGAPDDLHRMLLAACRMLLVTRGVEAKTEKDVFAAFQEQFIDTGIVDMRFHGIVAAARRQAYQDLEQQRPDALALTRAVEALYRSMDDSLQFTVQKEPEGAGTHADRQDSLLKDYRGVACPMNFVKVKRDLSSMSAGAVLEVLLDDGEPIENVPGSVAAEGHGIVERRNMGDYWKLTIRKAG